MRIEQQAEAPVYLLKAYGMTELPRWISPDPISEKTETQDKEDIEKRTMESLPNTTIYLDKLKRMR